MHPETANERVRPAPHTASLRGLIAGRGHGQLQERREPIRYFATTPSRQELVILVQLTLQIAISLETGMTSGSFRLRATMIIQMKLSAAATQAETAIGVIPVVGVYVRHGNHNNDAFERSKAQRKSKF